jgi:hypothetical protein
MRPKGLQLSTLFIRHQSASVLSLPVLVHFIVIFWTSQSAMSMHTLFFVG